MTPLEGARAALTIVELLWRARRAAAAHGVHPAPGEAARLRAAGADLRAATEALERGEEGAAVRVSEAIERTWSEVGRADTVQGLLSEANRAVRGDRTRPPPGR